MVEQKIVPYFPSVTNAIYKPSKKDSFRWYYGIVFYFDHINATRSNR